MFFGKNSEVPWAMPDVIGMPMASMNSLWKEKQRARSAERPHHLGAPTS